ncbi:MAG: class I SAM-dependent methyltransferase [Acidobacteriota bacterium]|nr:class I SAM-dependent methyltransferase [Acidobacteriota bacterium]MDE3169558.1 class I SAM-dependent methyltransferase [Acidobacteriota bacterium]
MFESQRIPEPEVMDDSGEVEAYSSAAAQSYLDQIDNTFVARAVRLVNRRERGRALDVGTGPGQIVVKLARQLTRWKFAAVDRSSHMIAEGVANLAAAGPELAGRVEFQIADANALPFPDATFDLVVCNSVLHHMFEPERLLAEIARVAKPRGAVLLRDLRRPNRLVHSWHVRRHGRHYTGKMRELYEASVRAAYVAPELQRLAEDSRIARVRVFSDAGTHIGIERPISE